MASEVPVVGCNAGGIPHTIRPVESTGSFLVETGDIDGYVEKLTLLQKDPELRQKMGKRARDEMLKWSWEDSMADLREDVYQIAKENKHKRFENRLWRVITLYAFRQRIKAMWVNRKSRQSRAMGGGTEPVPTIVASKLDGI